MSENLPNKAVFQSYIWTCAKYDFSPYEKRIIYRLIEFAQHWLEGVKIKDHMHKIEPTDCGVNITMPVADILRDETDNNYAKAKAAFTSLSKKKGAEYEDDEIWFYTAIIEHPKIKRKAQALPLSMSINLFGELRLISLRVSKNTNL